MSKVIPIARIFDYAKAIEFYVDWLGFHIDWEHRPEGTPVIMQVSLRDIVLRLSEHHGDGSPGIHIAIDDFTGLRDYHDQLMGKHYKYNRPGIEVPEWNEKEISVTVTDPFGNKLIFSEVP